jgi:hypothetical protein
LTCDTLLSQSARERGVLRADGVRLFLDEHCSATRDHRIRLSALLMLDLWFLMWIDAPAEAAIFAPVGVGPQSLMPEADSVAPTAEASLAAAPKPKPAWNPTAHRHVCAIARGRG